MTHWPAWFYLYYLVSYHYNAILVLFVGRISTIVYLIEGPHVDVNCSLFYVVAVIAMATTPHTNTDTFLDKRKPVFQKVNLKLIRLFLYNNSSSLKERHIYVTGFSFVILTHIVLIVDCIGILIWFSKISSTSFVIKNLYHHKRKIKLFQLLQNIWRHPNRSG